MRVLVEISESFKKGEEKAILERASRGGPTLGGCAGPEFDAWVESVYAPYNENARKASEILEPKNFFKRYAFKLGYSFSAQ